MYPGSIGWGFVSGYSDRTTATMPRVEPLSRVPVIAIVIALPSLDPAQEAVNFRFVDITEFAGIDFTTSPAPPERSIWSRAGAVFFDYDGDLDPALSLARAVRLIGRTQFDGRLEFELPVERSLPTADLADAGEIDGVVAVDSEKSVASKKGKKRSQGTHVLQRLLTAAL